MPVLHVQFATVRTCVHSTMLAAAKYVLALQLLLGDLERTGIKSALLCVCDALDDAGQGLVHRIRLWRG